MKKLKKLNNLSSIKSDFWRKLIVLLVIFLLCMIVFEVFGLMDIFVFKRKGASGDDDYLTLAFHAGGMIILTFVIALAAWYQLGRLRDSINSDFLLRMLDHYTSQEIIQARSVIHELHLKSKEKYPEDYDEYDKKDIIIMRWQYIGSEILELSKDNDKVEKFSYLLSFLDYLEFISYFANENKVHIKDLMGMVGNSLDFYCEIFSPYIERRRKVYGKKNYYCEFKNLVCRELYKHKKLCDCEK